MANEKFVDWGKERAAFEGAVKDICIPPLGTEPHIKSLMWVLWGKKAYLDAVQGGQNGK